MTPFRKLLLAAGTFFLGNAAQAQRSTTSTELQDFSMQRIRHQKTIGLTLGSFALANIAVGSIAASQTSGETKYVHRMNVYWNLVNLGIAGAGLLGTRKRNPAAETLAEAVRQHENMKQILLINAGLDVAYVAGGAYLRERAVSRPDNADQLRGYGTSIMAQGAFLLVFDVVNYLIFKNRGDKQERLLLSATTSGVGVTLPIR
ncbi:hypothetical protein IC229_21435 [Spirosoma sp. BT702]|uniref:DUF4134 domain-containing protein n=1 Tax=Spirosoma profusum TaxID=2771354 RepID=A0A926XYQ0_9BACT|nr:hypothetical protein [Spirosoma profusum]MBD2703222.1 hypothetical protein [Spirosoma profusum]